jgi:electron transfer flavoprotein beta subunit
MKILVCMSVVPDTTTKISFTENNTRLNKDGVQFVINPYDELTITKALELTEAQGGTVSLLHVGTAESDAVIRKGLALGATDAFRIDAEAIDGQFVAEQIAAFAKDKGFDVIMTGRESIDYNGGQVCGLLGELLQIPSINVVSTITLQDGIATLSRDIDGGKETLTTPIPFVMSAQKDLCEPRIPNMKGIMSARTKPLSVIPSLAIGDTFVRYESYESPKPKAAVRLIDADKAEELMHILKNEVKVI